MKSHGAYKHATESYYCGYCGDEIYDCECSYAIYLDTRKDSFISSQNNITYKPETSTDDCNYCDFSIYIIALAGYLNVVNCMKILFYTNWIAIIFIMIIFIYRLVQAAIPWLLKRWMMTLDGNERNNLCWKLFTKPP